MFPKQVVSSIFEGLSKMYTTLIEIPAENDFATCVVLNAYFEIRVKLRIP